MFNGAVLKKLRENKSLTTAELAEEVKSTQSTISSIENNLRLPNANLVEILANYFEKPISEFYTDNPNTA